MVKDQSRLPNNYSFPRTQTSNEGSPNYRPRTKFELEGIELDQQFQTIAETFGEIRYRHYRQQVLKDLIREMAGKDISAAGVEEIIDTIDRVMDSRNYLPEGKDFFPNR